VKIRARVISVYYHIQQYYSYMVSTRLIWGGHIKQTDHWTPLFIFTTGRCL